jgi:hypothetical protein
LTQIEEKGYALPYKAAYLSTSVKE